MTSAIPVVAAGLQAGRLRLIYKCGVAWCRIIPATGVKPMKRFVVALATAVSVAVVALAGQGRGGGAGQAAAPAGQAGQAGPAGQQGRRGFGRANTPTFPGPPAGMEK